MTQIIKGHREEVEEKAADKIVDSVLRLLSQKDQVIVAIPGGRSVAGVFHLLKEKDLPWNKIHIFMVDERLVPVDDAESNFKLANDVFIEDLINNGKLPKGNVHPFLASEGIAKYEEELKKHGGVYDVVLLSSGEDGHIGSLYPHHHSISNESAYFVQMNDSPKPPPNRMTMSRKLLLKAKVALIMFLGEAKREAYNKFLDKKLELMSCPAKLVQLIPNSFAFTDLA